MPPLFNRVIFDIFKDQWIFDKLSGLAKPRFITPGELAQRLATVYHLEANSFGAIQVPGVSSNYYMTAPLPHLRQLNWMKLIQREHMDRQFTSHRISESAATLLKFGSLDLLDKHLHESELIDTGRGIPDPYIVNTGWNG